MGQRSPGPFAKSESEIESFYYASWRLPGERTVLTEEFSTALYRELLKAKTISWWPVAGKENKQAV